MTLETHWWISRHDNEIHFQVKVRGSLRLNPSKPPTTDAAKTEHSNLEATVRDFLAHNSSHDWKQSERTQTVSEETTFVSIS